MRPSFSIVILTYNGLHHLKRHLPGVLSSISPGDEVIVADNASADGTREWLHKAHPGCGYLGMAENLGYCGGNNRAAGQASGDVLIFLNNDVEVAQGWLDPLRRVFEDEGVWGAQPKILSLREPDRFEYAGAAGGYLDGLGYPFCRGRIFHETEMDEGQYDAIVPILWASGAALAFRRGRFAELGGFDESFEFHMEEIDLCWRAWNRGGRILAVPQSRVFHLGGGSLERGDPKKTFYNYRNNLSMLVKNIQGARVVLVIAARLLLDGISSLPYALRGRWDFVLAIINAHLGFYRHLPDVVRKRRIIAISLHPARPKRMLYPRSIVIQAFFFKRTKFKDLPECPALLR